MTNMESLLPALACLFCVVILAKGESIYGRTSPQLLSRSNRSTTCAAKFKIVSGHTACLDGRDTPVVSAADKQLIVNKHNQYRAGVTPTASNMMKLRWDDEVAMLAQKWADQCLVPNTWHEAKLSQRDIPGRFKVGQNVAINSRNWTEAMDLWYKEVKIFAYGNQNNNDGDFYNLIGHYTQITWAETTLVGCGMSVCNRQIVYVCNYGMAGNWEGRFHEPYKRGTSCADCPGHCVDSKLCDCNLTCLNEGKLNPETCTCICIASASLHLAPDCALNCAGTSDERGCENQGTKCPEQLPWCPHKCNYCPLNSAGTSDQSWCKDHGECPKHHLWCPNKCPYSASDYAGGDSNNGASKSFINIAALVLSLFLFFVFV